MYGRRLDSLLLITVKDVLSVKRTARIAWCGMMGALASVCLLLTVFPFATYALPALASVFLLPVVIECGRRWAVAVYAVVSVLSFLIAPDMEARMLFVLFFGYYPIVKSWTESHCRRVTEWVCKLGVFNVAVVAAYAILSAVGFSLEVFAVSGIALPLGVFLFIFLLLGNVVFVLYDIALTRLLPLYFGRFRPLFLRMFR